MNKAAITTPHAIGFRPASARPENVTIPAIDPRMSSRYASSAGNRANRVATPWATVVMVSAVAMKTKGSISQTGSPCVWTPKYTKSPPVRSIVAGNPITRPRKRARTTGAKRNRSGCLWARRNPIPMPRKLPSRMKLAK